MARDISFMQYMRAHGNTPGPTQRPFVTGTISGAIAAVPFIFLLYYSGALGSMAMNFSIPIWRAVASFVLLSVVGGLLYAFIFKRAANDTQGGWIFGMSYGFLLWVLGPVALWQVITDQPVAVGVAAMGIFGAQVLYGLVLGLVFPYVHRMFRMKLGDLAMSETQEFGGESKTK